MSRYQIWRAAWVAGFLGLIAGFQWVIHGPASGSPGIDFAASFAVFLAAAGAGVVFERRVEVMIQARSKAAADTPGAAENLVGERI